mmetsp:Transcript_42095/g.75610  ORF Transcript_42095/g.75610 Transcript_42095/m.75610 type:complete len:102 (+) Transcript_42095:1-306(+)
MLAAWNGVEDKESQVLTAILAGVWGGPLVTEEIGNSKLSNLQIVNYVSSSGVLRSMVHGIEKNSVVAIAASMNMKLTAALYKFLDGSDPHTLAEVLRSHLA